jgi:hypothetical protein
VTRRAPGVASFGRAALAWASLMVGWPAVAGALEWNLQLNPGYTYSTYRSTGSIESSSETQSALQKYRASIQQQFSSLLRLDLSGNLDWTKDWTRSDGQWSSDDRKIWNTDARLTIGSQPLSSQLYYQFQQRRDEETSGGLTTRSSPLDREGFGLSLQWSPAELPVVSFLFGRTLVFDPSRQQIDTTTDNLTLSAQYSPARQVSTRYALAGTWSTDHLAATTSNNLAQTAQVAYSDTLLDHRLVVAAAYTGNVTTTNSSGAAGHTITIQLAAQTGLAVVEPPTATPTRVVLSPSPALVDGVLTVAAGIDLGWGASASGDNQPRDLGARFADPLTEVGLLYVYVDRRLPPNLVPDLLWSAYRSDDGENWTEVALAGAVTFGDFDNRFEIPITATRATYFKVVTRPLTASATTDRQYQNLLVTELQLFRTVVSDGRSSSTTAVTGTAAANARYFIYRPLNLTYEMAASLTNSNNNQPPTWSLTNALGANAAFNSALGWRARVDHSLSAVTLATGRAAQNELRLTVGLDATPLPTARASMSYQGQASFEASTLSRTYNSGLFSLSAEPYRGIFVSGDASLTKGTQGVDRTAFSATNANASMGVKPNPWVQLIGSLSYSDLQNETPTETSRTRAGLVSATLSLTPIPALVGSATVSHYAWGAVPNTIWNLSGNFSPFPGGRLLISLSYNESIDIANDARTRVWGPSLRWTLRSGTFLTASYTDARAYYALYDTVNDTVFVTLLVTL